jgi:hypothetical protein
LSGRIDESAPQLRPGERSPVGSNALQSAPKGSVADRQRQTPGLGGQAGVSRRRIYLVAEPRLIPAARQRLGRSPVVHATLSLAARCSARGGSSPEEDPMSIFGSIMNKIFHRDAAGGAASADASAKAAPGAPGRQTSGAGSASAASPAPAASGGGAQAVDVEAVLSGMASKQSQKLDWHHSIVDLMKLLDLDSSLSARKELAKELNYTGDMSDSAKMNIWLHKQVMQKLAENGGKVPESLRT